MSASPLTRSASARIPTEYGEFQLCCFTTAGDDKTHLAFYMGEIQDADDVLVRVHSECFTGDVLGSQRCDCGEQLDLSLQKIAAEARVRHFGRATGARVWERTTPPPPSLSAAATARTRCTSTRA